jgi:hypothetical protein
MVPRRPPNFFPCQTSIPRALPFNSLSFHSPYTLPSSVARKSFACHSYENCRGVYPRFPFWNSSPSLTIPTSLPSFHALTGTPFCNSFLFIVMHGMGGTPHDAQTFRPADVQTIPPVPLQPTVFGATIRTGTKRAASRGKQIVTGWCLTIVSGHCFWMTAKRTSGIARFGSRLQVVPGSSVLLRVSGFVLTNPELN